MKIPFVIVALSLLGLAACKKEKSTLNSEKLAGGKGGTHNVAIFCLNGGKGITARVYLKYASKTAPADTNAYDEKFGTMTEPGYGPHAHFNSLLPGTYYFKWTAAGNISADKVVIITDASPNNQDIELDANP